MSYDVEVYSVRSALEPDTAAQIERLGFTLQGARFSSVAETWQIVLDVHAVELEDIPEDVAGTVPGLAYLVRMHLEGDKPNAAFQLLRRSAKEIAKLTYGVVFDQQTGKVTTPPGVKRVGSRASTSDRALLHAGRLELEFIFEDRSTFAGSGYREVVEVFRRQLPEALPRRYGLVEPPPFKLAREGYEHFLDFLRDNLKDVVVWYPAKPIEDVFLRIWEPKPAAGGGGRISMVVLDTAPAQPGWKREIERVWLAIGRIVRPFYAEIRRAPSPICAWNGIPAPLGYAAMLGPPYLELWPAFRDKATPGDGFHWASSLAEEQSVESIVGAVPPEIAQPPNRVEERDPNTGELLSIHVFSDLRYPDLWPFGSGEPPGKRFSDWFKPNGGWQ